MILIGEEPAGPAETARFFSIHLRGNLVGYMMDTKIPSEFEGRPATLYFSRTVFGAEEDQARLFNGSQIVEFWVDPDTKRVLRARREDREGEAAYVLQADFSEHEIALETFASGGKLPRITIPYDQDVFVPYCLERPARFLEESGVNDLSLRIFNLRERTVESARLRRLGAGELDLDGKPQTCQRYSLDYRVPIKQTIYWIDANEQPVRIEEPGLGFITQAIPPEKAPAWMKNLEDLPALSQQVPMIEDRAGLTYLELEAVIECPGLNEAQSLSDSGQTFEGTVENGTIAGTFKIRAQYLDRGRDPGYPVKSQNPPDLASALKPEPGIEADDPEILEKARELAKGLTQRWHVMHALGAWVYQQIVYLPAAADTAKAAFQEGQADALGMARLFCAFCRGLEIPARIVHGGLFVRFRKGSAVFAKHAWCEVHMGEAGWVPLDPAKGAFTFLDAGHLRLGGEADFNSAEIEINDFIPKPPETRSAIPRTSKGFPLSAGKVYIYDYFLDDQPIGTERVSFIGMEPSESPAGEQIFMFSSQIDLNDLQGTTVTMAYRNGGFHMYRAEMGDVRLSCQVKGDYAVCHQVREDAATCEKVRLPRERFFFDARQVVQLGFMLSRMAIEPGDVRQVEVFRPAAQRVMVLQVELKGLREVDFGGEQRNVRLFNLMGGGQQIQAILDEQGTILEEIEQGGRIRVTLRGVED